MLATNNPAGWMRSPRAATSPVALSTTATLSASGSNVADVDARPSLVHAEKGERVAVAGVDDRLDLGAGTMQAFRSPA